MFITLEELNLNFIHILRYRNAVLRHTEAYSVYCRIRFQIRNRFVCSHCVHVDQFDTNNRNSVAGVALRARKSIRCKTSDRWIGTVSVQPNLCRKVNSDPPYLDQILRFDLAITTSESHKYWFHIVIQADS